MKASTEDDYRQRILRVQHFLEANLEDDVKPAELARLAGFSLHHFHRIFRGLTDESVLEFRRRIRLEQAARRLRDGGLSVTDAAFEAGYGSHEAFTRAFRRHFGVPPKAYRGEPGARRQGPPPQLPVTLRDEPERKVVCLRHTGPYIEVGSVWDRLMGWQQQMQVKLQSVPPWMFGLVSDDPEITEQSKLRYDACIAVDCETALDGLPVQWSIIPGGRYALVVHEGSYETLHGSYLDLIGRWQPRSGYRASATPVVECYLNSPYDTRPDDLRTEIWMRLED